MNRTFVCHTAMVVFCCFAFDRPAYAEYTVRDSGTWPATWPKELEPLRKQARTLEGPKVMYQHFAIRFTTREQFEAAWPHLLKVRSKGVPITLSRGSNFFLGEQPKPAGVVIHAPPAGEAAAHDLAKPPPDASRKTGSHYTTSIELVVDGEIVDLNRIPLPPDTPIVDQRFKNAKN